MSEVKLVEGKGAGFVIYVPVIVALIHVVSPMRSPGVQRYVAAAELGSGEFVNPVVPEDAAAALRGA